ncbi:ATPase family AAA domain-containing protein 5 isoform X1 [Pipistrellus kuhlii]|uniref:ATPase family AAA domain-containing protein 5 n=1 Tax=Pipistrellus kuhlii TaxID=59472 RepID=A0A7J7TK66_PIPKU|nr:ATPase family AAA domain-containing protein 5 isoform X1 [Pipistrellus kuhlii]KAF6301091.1 ATPase family AAA domain containing 5 [Pipistrellus kuhlii]
MVGVLAMAAAAAAAPPPVKGYEIEACKKRRRDDDRSSSETITKYLSPVEKTGDRVFSPPKSSNIMDYFRKTSPTNEKTQLARECKIKSSAPLPADIGKDGKIPLEMFSNIEFKKRRRTVNLSHQLSNIKPENESPIEINSDDSKEDSSLNNDVVESSTFVSHTQPVEILAESIQDNKNQSSIVASKRSSKKVNPKLGTTENDCKNLRKRKRQEIIDLSESLPLAEELNLLKKDCKDSKQIIPSLINEIESTTDDITKPAQLNDGTITVSYEEFLRSHKENKLEQIPDSPMSICVPSETVEGRVTSGCTSDPETCDISQQAPFKTVTVLAQVHPIPPKKTGKIPSIFLKQKQLEMESSLSDPENEQTIQKRKSNVVIREEELELAVLEAASSEAVKPKCTPEERQQFMKAFRQPASDALKSGVKKSDKQKEPDEKSSSEEERDSNSKKIMENPNNQMVSDKGSSQAHSHKRSFPKEKCQKLKKKGKKMLDIGATSGKNREGNPQMRETTFSFKGKQSKNKLRMSLRQKKTRVFKDSPLVSSASFICEDRANDDPLKICSQYNKSSRKTSTPVKDKVIYPKAETEDSLVNVFTPKSTRRSLRGNRTSIVTIIGGTDSEDAQDICSVKASTPRASKLSEKHSLYTAELITISSDSESPIRMKFTRISTPKKSKKKSKKSSKKSEATGGDFTYQTRKASSTSKNVSKAKQLIEKAKALHISRSKAAEEIVTPLRRSSRRQILPEGKKMSDTEDSVIIINSSPTSLKHPETNQKKLQCLNDVLGKKPNKTSKNEPGKMKIAPLFLTRKVHKTADPILGFDESSQDTSERSQDCDVRLKAKRDFLMSGLPDLLKRQIAKKSAALDVYNVVSTSFQKVVHVQQKDDGCYLWHLKPPTCSRLIKLKQWDTKVNLSKCVIALGEFSTLNSSLKSNNSAVVYMGRRKGFTEEVRNLLLEEITCSNPEFSLMKYFPLLLKKNTEHQLLSECHYKQENPQLEPDVNLKETKRKRVETKNYKSKRRKPNEYSENITGKPKELEKTHKYTGIKLDSSKSLYSKTRSKKQTAVSTACEVETEAVEEADVLIIDDDKASTSEISSFPDSGTEDMLWTEKYQPQNSSELIGNELAIKKLHSWLKDWKRRAELEERQNLKGKRDEKQEDLLDVTDFKGSSDEEENRLCNTVLITGPTGVGKTAAVYACAQELGFKIFEVNASSQRSGRQILSQLKEATQSHQVDKQGVNSQKPCFFNSYNIGKSPKKLNSPKKVVTSPRRLPPSSPQSSGPKRALPPKTLANYFKVSSKPKNNEEIGELPENNKGIKNFFEQKQTIQTKSTNTTNSNIKEYGAEEPNRKSATSLILFEEVDVIFEEDAGFLNAIKTFMATTKRPVILTTSDPSFSLMFDGCFEEINFDMPSLLNVASYLQTICLTENFRTDIKDFVTLLTANTCDIRKSILYLQFWIRSGGGFLEERPLSLCRENSRNVQLIRSEDGPDSQNNPKNATRSPTDLPKCDTSCVETLFGLKNIFPSSEDLFSFLKHKIRTKEEWHKLIQVLTEFQMRNVDFLYSNLEFILPLPVDIIPETEKFCGSSVSVDTSGATKNMKCLSRKHPGEKPLKKSQKKKHKKKMVILDDSDLFDTNLDFSDEFLCLHPDSSSSEESKAKESNSETKKLNKCLDSNIESNPHLPETPAEKKCSALVSHCLNSLTEFMDNMSFLDALLPDEKELGKHDFSWTNGKVKSGLCDEFSLENNDRWTFQNSGELKAVVEALSFTQCSSTISKALETLNSCKKLGKDPTKDLTLSVSQKRTNVYFSQTSADLDCARKRITVIKSVFSSRSLLNLANRQASIIEYLPTLRNICRTEKLKEQGKSKRRFLHYLEGIHLNISKETMNTLAADFP